MQLPTTENFDDGKMEYGKGSRKSKRNPVGYVNGKNDRHTHLDSAVLNIVTHSIINANIPGIGTINF